MNVSFSSGFVPLAEAINQYKKQNNEDNSEMDFWLELWPEYDYLYQEEHLKDDMSELMKNHSMKEIINSKFITQYLEYKQN